MRNLHLRRQFSYDIDGRCEDLPPGELAHFKKLRLDSRERRRLQRRQSQTSRARSPQKVGSRSRSRSRRRVVALPHGLLQCTGGVRSRSATPERHCQHRVHTHDKENAPDMLSSLKRKIKNFCEKDRTARVHDTETSRVRKIHSSAPNLVRDSEIYYQCPGRDSASHSNLNEAPVLALRQQTHEDTVRISYNNNFYSSVRQRQRSGSSSYSGLTSRSRSISSIQARPLPPIPSAAPPISAVPPKESTLNLIKTLDLKPILRNKWISGLAVTRKGDIVVVDLKDCHILDSEGQLKRSIGLKGSVRLTEPIDVTILAGGNLAVSDHADREVKVYTAKGQFVRRVRGPGLVNIAGVASNDNREVFIAGTDSQHVGIHNEEGLSVGCIPNRESTARSPFEHPYSIAINPLSGAVIVGDDYRQRVVAVSRDGKVLWRFCPTGDRLFFPSSICVDAQGYVFVADLYNEKVYMLDSGGKYLKTLLSRGDGLRGAPSAIAVDGTGRLYVADDEKTLKIFQYGSDGFALYRRFSKGPDVVASRVREALNARDLHALR